MTKQIIIASGDCCLERPSHYMKIGIYFQTGTDFWKRVVSQFKNLQSEHSGSKAQYMLYQYFTLNRDYRFMIHKKEASTAVVRI